MHEVARAELPRRGGACQTGGSCELRYRRWHSAAGGVRVSALRAARALCHAGAMWHDGISGVLSKRLPSSVVTHRWRGATFASTYLRRVCLTVHAAALLRARGCAAPAAVRGASIRAAEQTVAQRRDFEQAVRLRVLPCPHQRQALEYVVPEAREVAAHSAIHRRATVAAGGLRWLRRRGRRCARLHELQRDLNMCAAARACFARRQQHPQRRRRGACAASMQPLIRIARRESV